MKYSVITLLLVALVGVAGAHNVYEGAPHVTSAITVPGGTVELVYQSIELGQGRSFERMTAGEIQKNERSYKFYMGRLRQIGELSTDVPIRIGGMAVPAGKYYMGFYVDMEGNYSVRISSATDIETEIGRTPLALQDSPVVVPFLVQAFTPSATAGEIRYAVMFGKKVATLPIKVGGES